MCLAVSEKQSSQYSRSHLITTEKEWDFNSDFRGSERDNVTTREWEMQGQNNTDEKLRQTHEGEGKLIFVQKLFIHSQKQDKWIIQKKALNITVKSWISVRTNILGVYTYTQTKTNSIHFKPCLEILLCGCHIVRVQNNSHFCQEQIVYKVALEKRKKRWHN